MTPATTREELLATIKSLPAADMLWLAPRSYTVEFDRWGFGSVRPLNWCLRMYGHGGGCVANGEPHRFTDEASAHRAGKRWVELGK